MSATSTAMSRKRSRSDDDPCWRSSSPINRQISLAMNSASRRMAGTSSNHQAMVALKRCASFLTALQDLALKATQSCLLIDLYKVGAEVNPGDLGEHLEVFPPWATPLDDDGKVIR